MGVMSKGKKMNTTPPPPASGYLPPLVAKLDAFDIKAFPFGKEMVAMEKS